MFFRVSSAVSIGRRWVAVTVLFFAAACSQPTVAPPENPSSGEWRTFEGTWSASGTRQTLELETNHRASIFDLTGSLVLTGDRGLGVGFQSRAIGLTDSLIGMQGRCVWTDEHTSELQSPDHLVCRLLLDKKNKRIETKRYKDRSSQLHILQQLVMSVIA